MIDIGDIVKIHPNILKIIDVNYHFSDYYPEKIFIVIGSHNNCLYKIGRLSDNSPLKYSPSTNGINNTFSNNELILADPTEIIKWCLTNTV